MATTKRKPSAAQLAARARFAAMAKSGAFKRKATKVKTAAAKKAAPRKTAAKPARRANPTAAHQHHNRTRHVTHYQVHKASHGTAGALIATFRNKADAVQYANAYATAHKCPVVIVGKGL
jgi:hypothetical protein